MDQKQNTLVMQEFKRIKFQGWNSLSLLILLLACIILCLLVIICMGNFLMIYQTRNILMASLSNANVTDSIPQSSESTLPQNTFSTTVGVEKTTPTPTTVPAERITSTLSSTTLLKSSELAPVTDDFTTQFSSEETTPSMPKRNVISILNELGHHGIPFMCSQTCENPPIIFAEVNVSLSSHPNNYLMLTTSVMTDKPKIAKQCIAYLVMKYLYKERLNEAIIKPECSLPVSSNCDKLLYKPLDKCS